MRIKSFKFNGEGKVLFWHPTRHARDGVYILNYYGAGILKCTLGFSSTSNVTDNYLSNVYHPQAGYTPILATPLKSRTNATRCSTTITLMPKPQQQEVLFQEGKIDLGIQAHKQGQFPSFWKAIYTYNMPWSTAQLHIKGIKLKYKSTPLNHLLIPI